MGFRIWVTGFQTFSVFVLLSNVSVLAENELTKKQKVCLDQISQSFQLSDTSKFRAGARASFEPMLPTIQKHLEKLVEGVDPDSYSKRERILLARIFEDHLRNFIEANPDTLTSVLKYVGLKKRMERRRLSNSMDRVLSALKISRDDYEHFEFLLTGVWLQVSREFKDTLRSIGQKDLAGETLTAEESGQFLRIHQKLTDHLESTGESKSQSTQTDRSWILQEHSKAALRFMLKEITGSEVAYVRFSPIVWQKKLEWAFLSSFKELDQREQTELTSYFKASGHIAPPSLLFHRLHRKMLSKLAGSTEFYFLQLEWAYGANKNLRKPAMKEEVRFVSERVLDFLENRHQPLERRSYPFLYQKSLKFLQYPALPILVEEAAQDLLVDTELALRLRQITMLDLTVVVGQRMILESQHRSQIARIYRQIQENIASQLRLYREMEATEKQAFIEKASLLTLDRLLKNQFDLHFLSETNPQGGGVRRMARVAAIVLLGLGASLKISGDGEPQEPAANVQQIDRGASETAENALAQLPR